MNVVEDLNGMLSRRRKRLAVVARDGAAFFGAGAWPDSELASVVDAVGSVAPRPHTPEPQAPETKQPSSFWAERGDGGGGPPGG